MCVCVRGYISFLFASNQGAVGIRCNPMQAFWFQCIANECVDHADENTWVFYGILGLYIQALDLYVDLL